MRNILWRCIFYTCLICASGNAYSTTSHLPQSKTYVCSPLWNILDKKYEGDFKSSLVLTKTAVAEFELTWSGKMIIEGFLKPSIGRLDTYDGIFLAEMFTSAPAARSKLFLVIPRNTSMTDPNSDRFGQGYPLIVTDNKDDTIYLSFTEAAPGRFTPPFSFPNYFTDCELTTKN